MEYIINGIKVVHENGFYSASPVNNPDDKNGYNLNNILYHNQSDIESHLPQSNCPPDDDESSLHKFLN